MSVTDAMRRRRRTPRPVCRGLAVLAVLMAAPAFGEVTLETAVSKVETLLDASGRVKRELVPALEVVPGDELRYTITFTNEGVDPVEAERIVVTNPIPDGTVYLSGSAGGDGARVEYSIDGDTWSMSEPAGRPAGAGIEARNIPAGPGSPGAGAAGAPADPGGSVDAGVGADAASAVRSLRWTYERVLEPGDSEQVYFHVRMR